MLIYLLRLVKRATIVGRLFYHTAMCLIPQINPLLPSTDPTMNEIQLTHSHFICGIVAHVKDRGVASVALRSMAIAAEVLVERREQEEVLQIFEKIRKETGWKIGFLHNELKEKWGWNAREKEEEMARQVQQASIAQFFPSSTQPSNLPPAPPAAPRQMPPQGILNPLMKAADFSLPNHPYLNYYQPPNQQNHFNPHF